MSNNEMVCRSVDPDRDLLKLFKENIIPKLNKLSGAGLKGGGKKEAREALCDILSAAITSFILFGALFSLKYAVTPDMSTTTPVEIASIATTTFRGIFEGIVKNLPESVRREVAPCTQLETVAPTILKYSGVTLTALAGYFTAPVVAGAGAVAAGAGATNAGIMASIASGQLSLSAASLATGDLFGMYTQCEKRNTNFMNGFYAAGATLLGTVGVGIKKLQSVSVIGVINKKVRDIICAMEDEQLQKLVPGLTLTSDDSPAPNSASSRGSSGAFKKNTKRKKKPSKKKKRAKEKKKAS